MKEQRKFVRHDVRHLLDFFTTDAKGQKTSCQMGRMLNISINGMQIESPVDLEVATRLEITAGIADDLVDVVGKVINTRRHDNRYISGIQLISVSSEGRRIIMRHIEKELRGSSSEPEEESIH